MSQTGTAVTRWRKKPVTVEARRVQNTQPR